jgi:large conductance mechanosensitive channel
VVQDVIMPLVGMLLPENAGWREAAIHLRRADPANHVEALDLKYGDLLGVTVDFFIVAIVLFAVVSAIQRRKNAPAPTPDTRECPSCLESVPKLARRCRHCTETLVAA